MVRYIGMDVHREFAQLAVLEDGLVRDEGRIGVTPEVLRAWADGLRGDDQVALEATGNSDAIANLLTPLVERVVVSNPSKTRAIAEAKVKTDKVDARILAQLLAADFLPPVWLPDDRTRALRRQVTRRAHLVRQRTRVKNQVHAILARNLAPTPPVADLFGKTGRHWLSRQELPADERATVAALLRQLDFHGNDHWRGWAAWPRRAMNGSPGGWPGVEGAVLPACRAAAGEDQPTGAQAAGAQAGGDRRDRRDGVGDALGVVHDHDGAGSRLEHVRDKLPGGDAGVVVGVNGPADLDEAQLAGDSLHDGVGVAVRRADELRPPAGCRHDRLHPAIELGAHLSGRRCRRPRRCAGQRTVIPGVVFHGVSIRHGLAGQLRVLGDVLADVEERRAKPGPAQRRKQPRRGSRVGAVVEGERHVAVAARRGRSGRRGDGSGAGGGSGHRARGSDGTPDG
jgi:hypothetical protein